MMHGKKIAVVLPAYNAQQTLEKTYRDIPMDIVDEVILVDDRSSDETVRLARQLGIKTFVHEKNLGYGGNQKTCYAKALESGADVVVMLHPDYQYPPCLITAMASMIACGLFDVVLGSRILGGYALKGGMPIYKYFSNRVLTAVQNMLMGQKLSEYHTGYRAFSRKVLENVPILENSDDFVFDNQMLAQIAFLDYRIGEVSAPCSYEKDCSSISFKRSCVYGLGVLSVACRYALQKRGIGNHGIFNKDGRRLKGAA